MDGIRCLMVQLLKSHAAVQKRCDQVLPTLGKTGFKITGMTISHLIPHRFYGIEIIYNYLFKLYGIIQKDRYDM